MGGMKRQSTLRLYLNVILFFAGLLGLAMLYVVVVIWLGPSTVPPWPKPTPRMGKFGTYTPDSLPSLEELRRARRAKSTENRP